MITIKNLCFSYRNNNVIDDLSLEIKKGEFIGIIGHNGSGKSTLSKILIGLLQKKSGEIIIDGITLNEETIEEVRKKIGIVFQNPDNQFVGSTVRDDIAFGLENLQVKRDEMIELIDQFSKRVGMHEFLDREPQNLSGGQKQRVAIAGVLSMDTDIIIFDEATSMLDPKGRMEVIKLVRELNEEGKTVIMITHDLEEAKLTDKIFVLEKGKLLLQGTPKEIFENHKELKRVKLDIPMALNVLVDSETSNKEISELLWELSLKK